MPRVTTVQTNFTAGEVSPKCYGRVDISRYQNGAASMLNCRVDIYGGASRRPGKRFIAPTKTHSQRSRLVPYIFSTTQAYMLEFGHLYMRVYVQSGGQVLVGPTPYEIATPYTETMLPEMDYTQGADTMFIFHQGVPINTLKRFASDFWVLSQAAISPIPFDEVGSNFPVVATLSAVSGPIVTVTVPSATFLSSDIGRLFSYQSGLAYVSGYTSATSITINVSAPFPSTTLPANGWRLQGSPMTSITPSAKSPVGGGTTLTSTLPAWRNEDAGKFVRVNGGLVQIISINSPTVADCIIKAELSATVAAPGGAWSLESAVWTAETGYPRTGALYEQRLTAAGSPSYPQTIWGSRSGLPFDFTLGSNDDDAFSFSLPSTGQINPIQRMVTAKALFPLTYGGEYTMEGGNDLPLTPTNVKSRAPSVYGCNNVKPLRVGNEILFVQRAGRKIRSLAYSITTDTYSAPDLTVLAEHITQSGITDMAYQQEPGSTLLCVRADGRMATLTLDRDEGVTAWTPYLTDGLYESIASIPNATGDETWAIVNRTIGGVTKRYVERFDTTLLTDCAITGTDGVGKAIWTGIDHLEGKSVAVKADGVYMGLFTVTAGAITLPRNAFAVEIGLPYSNSVTLLRPELQSGEGSAQGNPQRIHEVSLLLADTTGSKINGDEIAFREFGENLLDVPPELFSGFKRAGLTEWTRGDEQITITQDEPYPFNLLAVVRKLTVNS